MHTYRSGIPIRLGPLTLIANLSSAIEKSQTSLKMVCPEHKCFVHQDLICDDGNHTVNRYETLRGMVTEDGMRIINPSETPKFEASETLDLIAVPADSLETHTTAGDSVFYVLPKPKTGAELAWTVFNEMVQDKNMAFVVSAALRKGRKNLFRLEPFNGYLALRQLRFPHQVREAPQHPEHSETKKTIADFKKLAKDFAGQAMVDWDKFDSADEYEDRLMEFVKQGELVDAPESTKKKSKSETPEVTTSATDMMEALKAAIKEGGNE